MKAVISKGKGSIAPIMAILLLLSGCQSSRNQTSIRLEPLINQEIPGEYDENILVGKIDRQGLAGENYRYWFDEEYHAYQVDAQALVGLESSLQSLQFKIFLGTWCSDSQRELPRFYKIVDYLGVLDEQLQVIALDNHPERYKQSPQHEEEGWNIEYVPTFIVLNAGREIGRIVEAPQESLERDLAMMLRQAALVN